MRRSGGEYTAVKRPYLLQFEQLVLTGLDGRLGGRDRLFVECDVLYGPEGCIYK